MTTRFLSVLPLFLLLGIIIGVGYFLREMWFGESTMIDVPPSTTPSLSTTYTPMPITTATATPSPSSTFPNPIVSVTGSPTPTPIPNSSTSTPTTTPTLPVPTPTYTLTPTPVPIYGIVTAENLNVRWGPSEAYGYVGAVYRDNRVIILGREPTGFWLAIEIPDGKKGWVAIKYIKILDDKNIPLTPTPPPPPPTPDGILVQSVDSILILRAPSVRGEMAPGKEREYNFQENQKETVLILIVKPNVIINKTDHVQFFIYYINAIGQANIVGVGSHPDSDRDGDLGTGELVWRGGPLVSGTRYYLRLINNSSNDIQYCLATTDIYHWNCE